MADGAGTCQGGHDTGGEQAQEETAGPGARQEEPQGKGMSQYE